MKENKKRAAFRCGESLSLITLVEFFFTLVLFDGIAFYADGAADAYCIKLAAFDFTPHGFA